MPDWGGSRPGAGRKPKQPGKSRVTLSTRISEDSSRILKAYAARTGKSQGEILDELVRFVQGQPGFDAHLAGELERIIPAAPAEAPLPSPLQ